MCTAWSVTALAGRSGTAMQQCQLRVWVIAELLSDVGVAQRAGLRAYILRPGGHSRLMSG